MKLSGRSCINRALLPLKWWEYNEWILDSLVTVEEILHLRQFINFRGFGPQSAGTHSVVGSFTDQRTWEIKSGILCHYIWYNKRKIQNPERLITGYAKGNKFTLLEVGKETDKQCAFSGLGGMIDFIFLKVLFLENIYIGTALGRSAHNIFNK